LPSNTPKPIQEQIHKTILTILNNPLTKKALQDQGYIPIGNKQDEFATIIRSELEVFKDSIKEIPN
jgi:tripartite-type tricarboxylate transporter receptor subunit TctC